MGLYEEIRDRLPLLYRPEDGDNDLFPRALRSIGTALDIFASATIEVLRSHWYRFADLPLYDPFYRRTRSLQERPDPNPLNKADQDEMASFPYIQDLARLAAILSLSPWEKPPAPSELLEGFRERISEIVDVYRNGLGTLDALRNIVTAQLPADRNNPPDPQALSFWIEEAVPSPGRVCPVPTDGQPDEVLGPLMRWNMTNPGSAPVAPILYIGGVAPVDGLVDATTNPAVELFAAGPARERLAIAYEGTLAADQTLRLRPTFSSWIATEKEVQRAESPAQADQPSDPTAPGPWHSVPGGPAGVVAMHQTFDRCLWMAAAAEGKGEILRYDGSDWTSVDLDAMPQPRCLIEMDDSLYVGTQKGIRRIPLYLGPGNLFTVSALRSFADQAVYALIRSRNGSCWAGTSEGLYSGVLSDDTFTPFGDPGNGAAVYAIHEDSSGGLFLGTELGLFERQPGTSLWHWYQGDTGGRDARDWSAFRKTDGSLQLPTQAAVHLPPVHCLWHSKDSSLWLGTENGISRFVAQRVGNLRYQTALEAFPELGSGRVFDIQEDERGLVWFCTEGGLFRFDGENWWLFQSDTWRRTASVAGPSERQGRSAWRFERDSGTWMRLDVSSSNPVPVKESSPASGARASAVCWTDGASAELGSGWGSSFVADSSARVGKLRMRYKPSEVRITEGGLPAVPRLPTVASQWRYLSLETAEPMEGPEKHLPAWTTEGRLQPPGGAFPETTEEVPGRFGNGSVPDIDSALDSVVFAYNPSARIWFEFQVVRHQSVLVRLKTGTAATSIEPAVLDRVWQAIQQVRPAGVCAALAVEERIVYGLQDGKGPISP